MHFNLNVLGRILAILLAVAGTGRIGLGLFAWRAANSLERPTYSVLQKLGQGVELRRYESYAVAETVIPTSNMKAGTGKGFQTVAGYIFGKNKPKAKMSMTAPVRISAKTGGEKMSMTAPVRTSQTSGKTRVSFVLEKAYSTRSAPRPLDGSVRLKEIRPHLLAARSFSGPPPSEERIARERAKILAALEASGLQPVCSGDERDTLVYGYHDVRTQHSNSPSLHSPHHTLASDASCVACVSQRPMTGACSFGSHTAAVHHTQLSEAE